MERAVEQWSRIVSANRQRARSHRLLLALPDAIASWIQYTPASHSIASLSPSLLSLNSHNATLFHPQLRSPLATEQR